MWGSTVRGSWRPNRNCNILSPTLMAVNVVSFSFSRCSTGGPGANSAGWWLSLLHLISIFSEPLTPSGFQRAPSAGCGFPYHISSITPPPALTATHQEPLRPDMALPTTSCPFPTPTLTGTGTFLTSVLTELYNSSTSTQSPTRSLKSHV